MSPIALGLDLILAILLISALGVGLRLNARLKTLQAGQAGFVKAAIELNQAAARADAGLTALRAAAEEVHDGLVTRIETARQLSAKLDTVNERVAVAAAAPAPAAPPVAPKSTALSRALPKPQAKFEPQPRAQAAPAAEPEAEEPTVRVRAPALTAREPIRFTPRPVKSAIRDMDDDLFEAPAGRAAR